MKHTLRSVWAGASLVCALAVAVAQEPPPETELPPGAPDGFGEAEVGPQPLPGDGAEPEAFPFPAAGEGDALDMRQPIAAEGEGPSEEVAPPDRVFVPGGPAAALAPEGREGRPGASGGYLIRPARREGTRTAPVASNGERNLRLNFRGAPLEMVLDYLSEAAGYIIVLETDVKGKLDVWSNQPLSQEEALDLLNQVLAKNGYAALQDGRTLTILTTEEAKKRDTPVRSGSDPAGIPRSDQVITQIIPVKFVNAVQLSRDLQPLFPPSATIASNEGGNAIVVTDTQTNIRRMAEIIKALDTAISSVSAVRVFPLQYADATSLATVIRDLFQDQNSARSGNNRQQQVFRGFRGGGPPGFGGQAGGQGGQNSGSGSSRVSTPSVVAVADERSNAVVVSAPEEQMPVIEDLVRQVDVNVDDITELRVFALRNSDPQEMADLLTELFPDTTSSNQSGRNRGQFRFGGPGGFAFGGAGSSSTSTRLQQQNRVTAVPDLRTASVVVSASRELMPEIGQIIAELDADPAKKQKVHVFSVENTDPAAVEEILRGLFETQNTRNRSTTSRSTTRQAGSQLNSRATSNVQNQGRGTSSRTGTTGFGTTSGVGR